MYLMLLLVAHTTSKSLLSFVHKIVCKLVWPSKIMHFVMFDANLICFKKTFGIIHMHIIHEKIFLKNGFVENFMVFQKF